jgi:hypothetical protein
VRLRYTKSIERRRKKYREIETERKTEKNAQIETLRTRDIRTERGIERVCL